ncbi:MAG: hypothetical protein K0R34_2933 [Herbinix sp.]|jgi:hypothetical protein|nr:hypothetical protein [Herbinix sp.]
MSFLGDIGSLYMLVLIALLIVGFGMIAKGFFDYLLNIEKKNIAKSNGSSKVQSGNWFRLSLYSLAGIIVSLLILSFISSSGLGDNTHTGNPSTASTDTHAHGASSAQGSAGLSNINPANLNSNNAAVNNYGQLQQQLSQMQNQINQLQSLIQNLNNSQSTTPGASGSGGMPMM